MVEDVEGIGTELQGQLVFDDRELLAETGVEVEGARSANVIALTVFDADGAAELSNALLLRRQSRPRTCTRPWWCGSR